MADDMSMNPSRGDFEALLDESMGGRDFAEGTVVKGHVAAIEKDFAIIDVGLKTEGRIPVKEFGVDDDGKPTLKVGDTVEVFLERIENALGEAVISR
ncbi:MAG: S1 RNA-binding domain-containing protein, partial [Caulobacteraceae bacterium]